MRIPLAAAALLFALSWTPAAFAAGPEPGTPGYVQRDTQNMADAYGRQTADGGQLKNPAYLPALTTEQPSVTLGQLAQQAASPTRPAITPGNLFPGWNVGNPLRADWSPQRGLRVPVAWKNGYGALIRGDVFAPLAGARDPYTHRRLRPPYPAVVITPGSVQGSERMYWWLAEDLAERGYVVLTYDVQGQGTSETLPHQGPVDDLPFCNPFAPPGELEQFGCPGVPSQQASNFVHGTRDATTFMLSSPHRRHHAAFNPLWRLLDRRRDRRTATPGRTTKLAIIGHSLGAAAVSYVQGIDRRVAVAVALDKLWAASTLGVPAAKPVVPALAVQSEYGFTVQPYWANNDSSITPRPGPPSQGPDPLRERQTGFDAWRAAKVDTMLVVPRASTHLEYTDIPLVLPASRYGQDLTSVYVQAWLDKYLKHDPRADRRLLARRLGYLEPVARDRWAPVTLDRQSLSSFYFCAGYAFRSARSGRLLADPDVAHVGC